MSDRSEKALARWLAADWWHTGERPDERRFWEWVRALYVEGGHGYHDEAALYEMAAARLAELHPGPSTEHERILRERVRDAALILDYLRWEGERKRLDVLWFRPEAAPKFFDRLRRRG